MSDLRSRLIAAFVKWEWTAASISHESFIDTVMPIIETELQKRDQDHFDALVGAESECLEETERLAGQLTEANKLLEQTIEVLEEFLEIDEDGDADKWFWRQAKPLLDNLTALTKEGTE